MYEIFHSKIKWWCRSEAGEKWLEWDHHEFRLANFMVNFININTGNSSTYSSSSIEKYSNRSSNGKTSDPYSKNSICVLELFQWQWIKLSTPNACPYFKDVVDMWAYLHCEHVYSACMLASVCVFISKVELKQPFVQIGNVQNIIVLNSWSCSRWAQIRCHFTQFDHITHILSRHRQYAIHTDNFSNHQCSLWHEMCTSERLHLLSSKLFNAHAKYMIILIQLHVKLHVNIVTCQTLFALNLYRGSINAFR